MKSLKTLVITIHLVLLYSCQDDWLKRCEDDNSKQVDFKDLRIEGIRECVLQNIDNSSKEVNKKLDNRDDLEKHLNCSYEGLEYEFDFEEYFILTGKFSHHQCAGLMGHTVFICNSKLVYQVNIVQLDCQAFETVYYGVLVPRIYQDLSVVFDVQFDTSL